MQLDTAILAAAAALTGSVVGACSSLAATFVGHRLQARWSRLAADLDLHEELYGKFVDEAAPLFIDALREPVMDPGKIVRLYSIMGRIRLTSTDEVLRAAEEVTKRLVEAYERPPVDPVKVLEEYAKKKDMLDPLLVFTEACRLERAKALQQV
jgi:hypothetical protein